MTTVLHTTVSRFLLVFAGQLPNKNNLVSPLPPVFSCQLISGLFELTDNIPFTLLIISIFKTQYGWMRQEA